MDKKIILKQLLDVQRMLLKIYDDDSAPKNHEKLIFGKQRVNISNALKQLHQTHNHCFELIIPAGKFAPLTKPAVELVSDYDILAEYGNFYKIDDAQSSPEKNTEEQIRISLLRIFGLLGAYSTELHFRHPGNPVKLNLSKLKQQAEDLNLIRKSCDTSQELRKLLDPIQAGDEKIVYLSTDGESKELKAWKLFQSFSAMQQQSIGERCKLETFGDLESDSFVGFRTAAIFATPFTAKEQSEQGVEEDSTPVPRQKNIIELLDNMIQEAKKSKDTEKLNSLKNKQTNIHWVIDFIGNQYGTEVELNEENELPEKTSYKQMSVNIALCADELERLGIETDLSNIANNIIFYREQPEIKIQKATDGRWLLEEIKKLYDAHKSHNTHEYFDLPLADYPELVKLFASDDRLSEYVSETYPGIVCYYMMQTNYERQHKIYPGFIRFGARITITLKEKAINNYVSQLLERAHSVSSPEEYILAGILQFDWIKAFFQKVQFLRLSDSNIGFEDDPAVVHMIKSEPLVKKLIEQRCNVNFMSMDDDFDLKDDEVISFSVKQEEADSPFRSTYVDQQTSGRDINDDETFIKLEAFNKLLEQEDFSELIKKIRMNLTKKGERYKIEDLESIRLMYHPAINDQARKYLQETCHCNWPEALKKNQNYEAIILEFKQ